MKKENNQKVQLSKNAKKVLAGVLATSMTLSGSMVSFADSVDVTKDDVKAPHEYVEVPATGSAVTTAGVILKYDEASAAGLKVTNPFEGADVTETIEEALSGQSTDVDVKKSTEKNKEDYYSYYITPTTTQQEQLKTFNNQIKKDIADKLLTVSGDTVYYSSAKTPVAKIGESNATGTSISLLKDGQVTNYATDTSVTAEWCVNPNEQEEYSFPMPEYTSGATFSTWVQVPESATEAAPIFTFIFPRDLKDNASGKAANSKNSGILTLDTKGTLLWIQCYADTNNEQNGKGNRYVANYNGSGIDTPWEKRGSWVYVTVTMKNDEFHVYYNGELIKATYPLAADRSSSAKNQLIQISNGRFCFKYDDDKDGEREILAYFNSSFDKIRPGILKGLTYEEIFNAGNWGKNLSDNSKVAQVNNYRSVMMALAYKNTEVYLGGVHKTTAGDAGLDGNGITSSYKVKLNGSDKLVSVAGKASETSNIYETYGGAHGKYTVNSVGLKFKGTNYDTKALTAEEVAANYNNGNPNITKIVTEAAANGHDGHLQSDNGIVTITNVTGDEGADSGYRVSNPFNGQWTVLGELEGKANDKNELNYADSIAKSFENALTGQAIVAHIYKDGSDYKIGGEKTKAEAITQFNKDINSAVANLLSVEGNDVLLNVSGEDIKLAEINDVSVTAVDAEGNLSEVSGDTISVTGYTHENNPNNVNGYQFPIPDYKKGVSISTWVRSSSKAAVPVFSFVFDSLVKKDDTDNYKGILTLDTAGNLYFAENAQYNFDGKLQTLKDCIGAKNRFYASFDSENSPVNNMGEWVYVTLTIKNDEFEVYYNGELAENITYPVARLDRKNGTDEAAYRFGFKQYTAVADATAEAVEKEKRTAEIYANDNENNVKDGVNLFTADFNYKLLKDIPDQTAANAAAKNVSKWNFNNISSVVSGRSVSVSGGSLVVSDGSVVVKNEGEQVSRLVMDILTATGTALYLGGIPETETIYDQGGGSGAHQGRFTDMSDGIAFYGMKSELEPLTSGAVKTAFEAESDSFKEYFPAYTGGGDDDEDMTVTDAAIDYTPATQQATNPNFETAYADDKIAADFSKADVNTDYISATTDGTDGTFKDIVTLGKLAEGLDESEYPNIEGVKVTNPFDSATARGEMRQDLTTAFTNTGIKFNGLMNVANGKWNVYSYPTYVSNVFLYYKDGNPKEWRLEEAKDSDTAFFTKQDAMNAYKTAKTKYADMIQAAEFALDSDAQYKVTGTIVTTEGAEVAPIRTDDGGKTVSYINKVYGTGSSKYISFLYNGPHNGGELVNAATIKNVDGQFSYPYPTWTNGATVSTWVKIPETATEATPIYSFVQGYGSLTLRSDGTVLFVEDTNGDGLKNLYYKRFEGKTPLANKGNWTYVTLSIKNDGVTVYYNGTKATETEISEKFNNSSEYTANFDAKFGYAESNIESRIKSLIKGERYTNLFGKAVVTEEAANITDDFANYATDGSYTKGTLLVNWLTTKGTELYLGGAGSDTATAKDIAADASGNAISLCQYTDANEGVQFDDMSFTKYPVTEEEAQIMYLAADAHSDLGVAYNDISGSALDTAAKVAADSELGDVVTLLGAVSDYAAGVQIDNPFNGHEELSEDLITALDNCGRALKAAIYTASDGDYYKVSSQSTPADAAAQYKKDINSAKMNIVKKYNEIITPDSVTVTAVDVSVSGNTVTVVSGDATLKDASGNAITQTINWDAEPSAEGTYSFPLPVYKNGVSASTWVKVPEGVTAPATIFTFVQGQQILTMKTDGTVFYSEAATTDSSYSNDDKRNYYRATYKGGTPLDNAGKWTYVTLTIKNDELQVFYNGKAATSVEYKNQWKTATKTFNGGFGFVANNETEEQRIAKAVKENRYQTILKNYGLDAVESYNAEGKWYLSNTDLIIDFLVDANTKLYLGGIAAKDATVDGQNWLQDAAGNWYAEPMGQYSADNKDMQVKGINTTLYVPTEADAVLMYNEAQTAAKSTKVSLTLTKDPNVKEPDIEPTTEPTTAPTTAPTAEPTFKLGDVDGDGDVDLSDAQMILAAYLKTITLTDAQKKAADVDENGQVDLTDAQKVLQKYLKQKTGTKLDEQ